MSLEEKLESVVRRHKELGETLASGIVGDSFARQSKEYSDLGPIVAGIEEWKRARAEAADLDAMLADPATDKEMKALAETERSELAAKLPKLERSVHPDFMLGWTLIHVLDDDSPLARLSPEALESAGAALIVTINGLDDATALVQHARHHYPVTDIKWGYRYKDIMSGLMHTPHLHYKHFHEVELAEPVAEKHSAMTP